MAEYLIRYKDVQSQADTLQSIGKTLATFESRLSSIANAMDTRDDSMASLKAQVKSCGKAVPVTANKCSQASGALREIATQYLSAERANYSGFSSNFTTMTEDERVAFTKLVSDNRGILSDSEIEMLNKLIKDPTKTAADILKEMEKIDLGKAGGLAFFASLCGVVQNFGKGKYYHGILDIIKYGGSTIADKMFEGQKVMGVKGTAAIGYVIDFFKNTYDNFYSEGNSTGRAIAETVGEAVVLVGTTCFATAFTTAVLGSSAFASVITGVAAIGATVGAPAIAVGAATIAVAGVTTYLAKKALDWAVTGITGGEYDSAVEFLSDTALDAGKALYDGAVGAAKKVTSAIGSAANWLFGNKSTAGSW